MTTGKNIFIAVLVIAVIVLIVFLVKKKKSGSTTSSNGGVAESDAINMSKKIADLLESGQSTDAATAQTMIQTLLANGWQFVDYGKVTRV